MVFFLFQRIYLYPNKRRDKLKMKYVSLQNDLFSRKIMENNAKMFEWNWTKLLLFNYYNMEVT